MAEAIISYILSLVGLLIIMSIADSVIHPKTKNNKSDNEPSEDAINDYYDDLWSGSPEYIVPPFEEENPIEDNSLDWDHIYAEDNLKEVNKDKNSPPNVPKQVKEIDIHKILENWEDVDIFGEAEEKPHPDV